MRLLEPTYRAGDVALALATAVLGGCLVLGVLAPLVAIYYHTSARFGVLLAVGSVVAALAVGTFVLRRNLARRAPDTVSRKGLAVTAVVMMLLLCAGLVQFIALASPILAAPTAFDGGIDALIPR
jgi:Kef-type K+ transport system membrane component KefB